MAWLNGVRECEHVHGASRSFKGYYDQAITLTGAKLHEEFHLLYASRPGGGRTLKTLGTAEAH